MGSSDSECNTIYKLHISLTRGKRTCRAYNQHSQAILRSADRSFDQYGRLATSRPALDVQEPLTVLLDVLVVDQSALLDTIQDILLLRVPRFRVIFRIVKLI